jgi:hypothetical protein
MASGFGKKHPAKIATPFLAGMAWRKEKIKSVFTRSRPLITRETVAIATRHSAYDNQKLLKTLPAFRFRSLENSIFEACSKYMNNPQPL